MCRHVGRRKASFVVTSYHTGKEGWQTAVRLSWSEVYRNLTGPCDEGVGLGGGGCRKGAWSLCETVSLDREPIGKNRTSRPGFGGWGQAAGWQGRDCCCVIEGNCKYQMWNENLKWLPCNKPHSDTVFVSQTNMATSAAGAGRVERQCTISCGCLNWVRDVHLLFQAGFQLQCSK